MDWRIGCSGFHYKEWKEVFYPEGLAQNKWFGFYCEHFNTLELNVTFYRFPQLKFLQNWYDKSPPGFKFAVKAPRLITHYKQLNGSEELLEDFYRVCKDGLKEKLACFLFQFPRQYSFEESRLENLVKNLDASFTNVVEFRHKSWWNEEIISRLGEKKIVFCGINHPELPTQAIVNTRFAYYRFHGAPELYRSSYSADELNKVYEELAMNNGLDSAYIFFNNTASAAALHNAAYLKTLAAVQ